MCPIQLKSWKIDFASGLVLYFGFMNGVDRRFMDEGTP